MANDLSQTSTTSPAPAETVIFYSPTDSRVSPLQHYAELNISPEVRGQVAAQMANYYKAGGATITPEGIRVASADASIPLVTQAEAKVEDTTGMRGIAAVAVATKQAIANPSPEMKDALAKARQLHAQNVRQEVKKSLRAASLARLREKHGKQFAANTEPPSAHHGRDAKAANGYRLMGEKWVAMGQPHHGQHPTRVAAAKPKPAVLQAMAAKAPPKAVPVASADPVKEFFKPFTMAMEKFFNGFKTA